MKLFPSRLQHIEWRDVWDSALASSLLNRAADAAEHPEQYRLREHERLAEASNILSTGPRFIASLAQGRRPLPIHVETIHQGGRKARYLLGHSRVELTASIYMHVEDDMLEEAAGKLSRLMFG